MRYIFGIFFLHILLKNKVHLPHKLEGKENALKINREKLNELEK